MFLSYFDDYARLLDFIENKEESNVQRFKSPFAR
jgi:hypothetical protein